MIDFFVRRWFDISITVLTGDEGDVVDENRRKRLEKNLDDVGWGLLFLAFAAVALPRGNAEYTAIAVVGAGMLVLNAVRIALAIPISWFSTILGATGLLAGSLALAGTHVDAFVVFCVLAGAVTIVAATIRIVRPVPAA
jgi:uncharacterized membrane protein YhhN